MYSLVLICIKLSRCIYIHTFCVSVILHTLCTVLAKCQTNNVSWILHHLRWSPQKCKSGLLLCACLCVYIYMVTKTCFPCTYTVILRYVCGYFTIVSVCMHLYNHGFTIFSLLSNFHCHSFYFDHC